MRTWMLVLVLTLGAGCRRPPVPTAEPTGAVNLPDPPVAAAEVLPATRPAEPPPIEEPEPPIPAAPTVEHSRRLPSPPPGELGTRMYAPSPAERPLLEALPEGERTTGSVSQSYAITGKVGQPVGWFGIIRGLREDPDRQETRLLVEMKYFDGLTDTHIMCVSFNGAGDFVARLPGTGHGLGLLSLVKVYGTVTEEKEGLPYLEATYLRHWEQGLFTFLMAYGTQGGSEAWREHNKVDLGKIYEPFPDGLYYYLRLGAPGEFKQVTVPE